MSSSSAAALDGHSLTVIEVRTLMKQREDARKANDFGKSDSIREKLATVYNVEVKDQLNGPSGWKFKDGRSNKLPPGVKQTQIPVEAQRSRGGDSGAATASTKSKKEQRKEGKEARRDAAAAGDSKGKRPREEDPKQQQQQQQQQQKKQKGADPNPNKQAAAAAAKPTTKAEPTPDQLRNKAALSQVMTSGTTGRNVQGVIIEELAVGTGSIAESGKRIKMGYVGRLKSNNKVFDASGSKPFVFRLGRSEVIKGWDIGCAGMREGGKRRLTIPPEKGYGRSGAPPTIPPNATLVFDVTLQQVL